MSRVGRLPPPSMRAIEDWVVPIRRASSAWVSKAFDLEFGQTTKWDGDQLIVIAAFFDAALQRQQIGLA
jgi:hypothetical protein